jgi:hypothetical protein
MRKGMTLAVAGLAALMTTASARADVTKKNAKFCTALGDFSSDVNAVRSMGPGSTVAELRAASARVDKDAHDVVKTAGKINTPTAKRFTDSARQLRVDASQMPDSITIAQAQSRIRGDLQNVERAARQLATESGCPEAAPQHGARP